MEEVFLSTKNVIYGIKQNAFLYLPILKQYNIGGGGNSLLIFSRVSRQFKKILMDTKVAMRKKER